MLFCVLLMTSLFHLGQCGFDPEVITGDIGGLELEYNGTIYFIAEKYRDFLEASFYCNRWGGKLGRIPNQEVFDFLKYAMGIQYRHYSTYIVGIMGDEIQKALVELSALPMFYYNCTAFPDLCKYAGAGPQDLNDTAFDQTCIFMGNCNSTKYVDIDGNDVSFLPWIENMEFYINMNQCVLMDVYDCEHLDGCHYAEFYPDDCSDSQEWAFICEKPASECPTVMEAPPLNETDEDYWEDFFGLETYCGYSYVRVVVNECAKRYLDLRNIRLGVSLEPDEFCAAALGNVVETRLGNGTCSAEAQVFRNLLVYTYSISGEFGEFLPPAQGDFISRATPMRTHFDCLYKRFGYTQIRRKQRVQTFRRVDSSQTLTGSSEIELEMSAYSDPGFTIDLTTESSPDVMIDDPIYFQISSVNEMVSLRAISCWVSLIPSPAMVDPHEILAENCTFQAGVSVISNNATYIQASFPAFLFTDNPTGSIYIHCTVQACSSTTGCQDKVCPETNRRRRSAVTNEQLTLAIGPIQVLGGFDWDGYENPVLSVEQRKEKAKKKALCRKKQCDYKCKALGSRAVCLCPTGTQVASDGKTCEEENDKKYSGIWDEEGATHKIIDGHNEKKKIQIDARNKLKFAVCTFIGSLVLCIVSFWAYSQPSEG